MLTLAHLQGVALEFFECLPQLDTPLISRDNRSALRVYVSGICSETFSSVSERTSVARTSCVFFSCGLWLIFVLAALSRVRIP